MTEGAAARLLRPAEISLGRLLLLALAVRAVASVWSRGYEFLDHQLQYVDPAYHVAFDASWKQIWDYNDGHRSWTYPYFLAGIFRLVHALGLHEPGLLMAGTRFAHGVLSLGAVAAFWWLVVRRLGLRGQRPLLIAFACNPILVYCSVQPTGPTFGTVLSVTAVIVFAWRSTAWSLLSGVLVGLAFACRFQDALFGFALGGLGIAQRRWGACIALMIGAAAGVVLQGWVDVVTLGAFLKSPIRYWQTNVGREMLLFTKPWWFFFVIAAGICLLVPPFFGSAWRALRDGGRLFPVLLVAAIFYVAVHSVPPRKAFRFVLPALILLMTVQAAGLLPVTARVETVWRRVHRNLFVGLQVPLLVFVSVWYFHRAPVESALLLGRQSDLGETVLFVDGEDTELGGHFYVQRKRLEVVCVPRDQAAAWVAANDLPDPLYVTTRWEALPADLFGPGWRLELVDTLKNWPDRLSKRRWVYRLRRDGN